MRILSYVILLGAMSILGSAPARALDEAELPSAIENAKTAADHEAIAKFYEDKAKASRAEAADHRKMGAVYAKHRGKGGTKAAHTPLATTMPPHCDHLAASYEAEAKEYEAMAAAHREEAKAAK